MEYGDNALAVGFFSFFGGNDFGGRRYNQNMAVNRHIVGTAHQGGSSTVGKIPTTTLQKMWNNTKKRSWARESKKRICAVLVLAVIVSKVAVGSSSLRL